MKVYPTKTKKSTTPPRTPHSACAIACAVLAFAGMLMPIRSLAAEPVVTVHAPTLKAGYDNLQAVLDQEVASFTGDFSSLIDNSLNKPLLMRGFNDAGTQALLVPTTLTETGKPQIALGAAASFASPGLSTSFLGDMKSLDAQSDFDAGLGMQPLVARLILPIGSLVPNLSIGVTAGFLDTASARVGIKAGSAGILAEYAAIRGETGMIAWNGLNVGMGLNYAQCRVTAAIQTGKISQPVEIDPDGNGPIASFSETIVVDPDVWAGIESETLAVNANVSTGLTFFKAISVFAGGGAAVSRTTSGIALDGNGTVNVTGYLAGLTRSPGTFSITGSAGERTNVSLEGYIFSGLAFRVLMFELTIPVIFTPVESVGTGVFIGVEL